MDSSMLRDEAAKERIRLAEEFLDPRKSESESESEYRCYCFGMGEEVKVKVKG